MFSHLEEMHRPPIHVYSRCGITRLCVECSTKATQQCKGWAVESMAKVFALTLRLAVLARLKKGVAQFMNFRDQEVHECGDFCNKRITQEQAKKRRKVEDEGVMRMDKMSEEPIYV